MKKKLFKYLKRMLALILGIVVLFTLAVIIFVKTAPQIGQKPAGTALERISQSPNYQKGEFVNLIETKMGSFGEMMNTLPKFIFGKNGAPPSALPVAYDEASPKATDSLTFITWYGHSAFLLEMDDLRVLIDPMLGPVASPVTFGSKRFPNQQPIPLEELTSIDAVILSHDHYDHLDYPTVMQIKDEVKQWYTALGVGSHLVKWGIDPGKITELDWWEEANAGSIKLVAAPARHFSGRGFGDRNATQWASWVIQGKHQSLYFSGDGGYGPHFKTIGQKYGPFELAMMECGQYNEAWAQIHMMPEESVQAGLDVGGRVLMPIHWGGFKLSVHSWTEPIERFKKASEDLDARIIHPRIGKRFQVGAEFPQKRWWELP